MSDEPVNTFAGRPRQPRAERAAIGRQRREQMPLDAHAKVPDAIERPSAVDIITAQDAIRIPALVPLRHERMGVDEFTFLRGDAAVMAADLGRMPSSGITVQLCGDAHLSNFGMFATAERTTVFDLNDFDETNPGPFEWDVKRLAASFTVAAQALGLGRKTGTKAAYAAALTYAETMAVAARMPALDVWNVKLDVSSLINALPKGTLRKATSKADAKSANSTSAYAVAQLTEVVDGRRQFRNDPPVLVRTPIPDADDVIAAFVDVYDTYRRSLPHDRAVLLSRFGFVDLGHRVVGVGSVGMRALVVLYESGDGEPLVLQVKEATTSVLEPYSEPSAFATSGERVVNGQRLMVASPDPFLGWTVGPSSDPGQYYVRQMRDRKASVNLTKLDAAGLVGYAKVTGAVLARAHARSGDASMVSGYLGGGKWFAEAISAFATSYAKLNRADYQAFVAATKG